MQCVHNIRVAVNRGVRGTRKKNEFHGTIVDFANDVKGCKCGSWGDPDFGPKSVCLEQY